MLVLMPLRDVERLQLMFAELNCKREKGPSVAAADPHLPRYKTIGTSKGENLGKKCRSVEREGGAVCNVPLCAPLELVTETDFKWDHVFVSGLQEVKDHIQFLHCLTGRVCSPGARVKFLCRDPRESWAVKEALGQYSRLVMRA